MVHAELHGMWSKWVQKCGGECPTLEHGVDVRLPRSGDGEEVAAYVAKWGNEVTQSHTKRGVGKTSRTPFQIMDDLMNGYNHRDYALLREYATFTKSRARLRWSKGLKTMFDIEEFNDEQSANKEVATTKFEITWEQFKSLRAVGAEGDLLDLADNYPVYFCLEFVNRVHEEYTLSVTQQARLASQERNELKRLIRIQTEQHIQDLRYGRIS